MTIYVTNGRATNYSVFNTALHVVNAYCKNLEPCILEKQIFLGCNEKLWFMNHVLLVVNERGIDEENRIFYFENRF